MKMERTMNRIKNLIAISAFSLLVLGLPAIASAQYGQYDPYGRNGGNNNRGYGTNMSSTVRNLKNRTRDFQRQLDRDLDRSRMNGTRREDQINEIASRFRDAVNDLDNNDYDYSRNRNSNYRGDNEMRRVFDLASQIERSIGRANVSYNTRNLWAGIRNDLQVLSRGYGNSGRNSGNGGWGTGRGNNNRNGLPSWWPF
jgi:hypothetical protein